MGKRFTDTTKYKNPWMRSLPLQYKVLWDYMTCDCDNAGIWVPDFEITNIYLGTTPATSVTKEQALHLYNSDQERIVQLQNGRWWIRTFVEFQYRKLSPANPAHRPIIAALVKYGLATPDGQLLKGHGRPFEGPMDKDKEMEEEMEGGKDGPGPAENPFQETAGLYGFWAVYARFFPDHIHDRDEDTPALGRISRFLARWLKNNGISGTTPLEEWERLAEAIKDHDFWGQKSLKSISNNLQTVIQEVRYDKQTARKDKRQGSTGRTIDRLAADILQRNEGKDD